MEIRFADSALNLSTDGQTDRQIGHRTKNTWVRFKCDFISLIGKKLIF